MKFPEHIEQGINFLFYAAHAFFPSNPTLALAGLCVIFFFLLALALNYLAHRYDIDNPDSKK